MVDALDALLQQAEAEHKAGWGPWKLDAKTRLLFMEDRQEPYCIRAEELLRDDELLYILLHLARRERFSNDSLGALVRASNAIRDAAGIAYASLAAAAASR